MNIVSVGATSRSGIQLRSRIFGSARVSRSAASTSIPHFRRRAAGFSLFGSTTDGPFVLHDVHLMTPRRGLAKLSIETVLNGKGPALVEDSTQGRMTEAWEVRCHIARSQTSFPTLIVGDFNMPTVSNLYRDVWSGFTDAFGRSRHGIRLYLPVHNALPLVQRRTLGANRPYSRRRHMDGPRLRNRPWPGIRPPFDLGASLSPLTG